MNFLYCKEMHSMVPYETLREGIMDRIIDQERETS